MEKIEFKSQICTTREQSERLLKLGLKKETADCALLPLTDKVTSVLVKPSTKDIKNTIPAWSLHRLMEIAYTGDILGCVALNFHERNMGVYYEHVIKVIEYLIGIKEFNKDYLEEKKC